MAWAIAVCIDLTCVMAARERHRDARTGRATGRLSWPTMVLVGGILLSLAANLAQADPTSWGWITAATPAGAFLVAVSMLERRTIAPAVKRTGADPAAMSPPPSFGHPFASSPTRDEVTDQPSPSPSSSSSGSPGIGDGARPEITATVPARPGQDTAPASGSSGSAAGSPAGPLVDFGRRVAADHLAEHGRPITRDALRARLGVSNRLASDLLRQIRSETPDRLPSSPNGGA